jgi:hypothetical protein
MYKRELFLIINNFHNKVINNYKLKSWWKILKCKNILSSKEFTYINGSCKKGILNWFSVIISR